MGEGETTSDSSDTDDQSTTDDGMSTDGSSSDGNESEGDSDDSAGEDPDACNVDSPYMGGWDIGCCQDEVVPTGWSPGAIGVNSVLPDWTMSDQFGDSVRLYDFCHDAIYFEYSAVW